MAADATSSKWWLCPWPLTFWTQNQLDLTLTRSTSLPSFNSFRSGFFRFIVLTYTPHPHTHPHTSWQSDRNTGAAALRLRHRNDNDMGRMLNERTNSSSVTDESSVSPASTAHAVAALCWTRLCTAEQTPCASCTLVVVHIHGRSQSRHASLNSQIGGVFLRPCHRRNSNLYTRRLTAANGWRVGIRVTNFLLGQGVVDSVKFFSYLVWSPCETWLLCCHTMWAYAGGPKTSGALGPAPLR